MTTLENMERALGCPSAMLSLPISDSDKATIGRWKHGDAEPKVSGGDGLIKLILNLSNTQKVEKLAHGVWTSKSCEFGSFASIGPDEDVSFSVRGRADVLQVFLPYSAVAREVELANSQSIRLRFQEHDLTIERHAFQILVALEKCATIDDLRLSE